MFNKILIANRGEVACRIMKAIKDIGSYSVLIYSEADKNEEYLKLADEIVYIGPASSKLSYLNEDTILQVALQYECQAIHPGYGFLAENDLFAKRCEQQKLVFIGAKSINIKLMGDKIIARKLMYDAGLKGIPGSKKRIKTIQEALSCVKKIGYPILLKAGGGGGGKGMRLVNDDKNMMIQLKEAQIEAENSFLNSDIYIEKYIEGGRHIEYQILTDIFGNVIHLGERECSIQRSHQKLLEETPVYLFKDSLRCEIGSVICTSLKKIGYSGSGTIEFLLAPNGEFYFIEMNTRLQVEHGISEMVNGIDIVIWQIRIALGEKLKIDQNKIYLIGASLECRINAENPYKNFIPFPGKIKELYLPKSNHWGNVRIEKYIKKNTKISSYYDSLIIKLITYNYSRAKAIKNMSNVLESIKLVGIQSTISIHKKIMKNRSFQYGKYDCLFFKKNLSLFKK